MNDLLPKRSVPVLSTKSRMKSSERQGQTDKTVTDQEQMSHFLYKMLKNESIIISCAGK